MTKRVLRFAPSPTGYLHVGNIRTALFNYLQAKKVGAEFILRLDDTDKERSSQHFIDQIKRDLEWLGIKWDRVEQQSLRIERYREVLNKFKDQKVVYECFETSVELELKRKHQQSQGKPPIYDRAALKLDVVEKDTLRNKTDSYWRFLLSGETVTWRDEIAGEINVRTSVVSDPILVKGNGQFLYTLASVIDDSDFGVTNVVRGIDHLTNTAVQIEIFRNLSAGLPVFGHHSLIVDNSGENFSKRSGSLSIKSLKEAGIEAGAVVSKLVSLGTGEDFDLKNNINELSSKFELNKFSTAPVKFEKEVLKTISRKLIANLSVSEISPYLDLIGVPDNIKENFWMMAKDNVNSRDDLVDIWNLCKEGTNNPIIAPEDKQFIEVAITLIGEYPRDDESWKTLTDKLKNLTGRSGKNLFMPLRNFLTGKSDGPDMKKLFPLMQKIQKCGLS
ncbi:glutamate--tRNA ligase [Paracoccaceae bacterium]|nr:glutamate--tRNA ligase [Paracoccaceae bacterium]